MEDLLNNPLLALIAGYFIAEFRSSRTGQGALNVASAAIEQRLKAAEEWIARHNDIGADFRGLSQGLETVTKAIEKLTERFDEWSAAQSGVVRRAKS